jgi:hypothetical protein
MAFRVPWNLWRHLEGGKISEFGLEAKRHLVTEDNADELARQYAVLFREEISQILISLFVNI